MSLISVSNLTFYYEGSSDNIFDNVSFQIDSDWKLGFVARNGRGKTTFLKLLSGKLEYRGSIASPEQFDYFPFDVEDASKDTMDIIEQLYPDYEFWKVCRELTLLQVDADVLYRPFATLSFGEQTKVMLAILFSMENRFLLIDEPTNHLDREARKIVSGYLRGKKGFILVSHDRNFLDECIDHVLVINKASIEVFQGNFSVWWENKQKQDHYELTENERLKRDIKRISASARDKALWADRVEATKIGFDPVKREKSKELRGYIGEKSRKMQMRRKNLERRQERAIEEKEGLLKNLETVEDLKLFPLKHHKNVLVEVDEVQVYYKGFSTDALTEPKYLSPVNFRIENGDRVVLQGKNGCGKSSIIKGILQEAGYDGQSIAGSQAVCGPASSIQGAKIDWNGRIECASGLIISYVSQDTGFLQGSLTDFSQRYGLELTLFMALLRKLDFCREQFEKRMEDFSGGQKKKVLIAKSLCERAHLYVWDEPLNFIDVFSRMQIEKLLLDFQPTMLFVEHDQAFVDKIGTKRVEWG